MPTRSWARASLPGTVLLATSAAAQAPTESRHAITVPALDQLPISVSVEPVLIDAGGEHRVKVIGTHGRLALVLDSYASRPKSMSRCQAGSERYVRLIDLAAKTERYHRLVESCLHNVVPGDPPASWAADRRSITIHLLSEPSLTIGIDAEGRPRSVQPAA